MLEIVILTTSEGSIKLSVRFKTEAILNFKIVCL